MDPDDGPEDEGPFYNWLPPDDRLWRHPSEVFAGGGAAEANPGRPDTPGGSRASGLGRFALSEISIGPGRTLSAKVWTVAVLAGVIGALAASGIGLVSGAFEQQTTVVRAEMSPTPSVSLASTSASQLNWTSVDDQVAASVVAIDVASASGPASGSGVVFVQADRNTYIITDNALVDDGGTVTVTFPSGQQSVGKIVSADALTGLALISVTDSLPRVPALAIGSVSELQVANPVLAVGARTLPGGSVFAGSVSGEDSQVDINGGPSMQGLITVNSSPIPPQDTGGPLVDQFGQVVGVTVSLNPTDMTNQAMSFAVPVDVAWRVAEEMLVGGPVTHPWLGVTNAIDPPSPVARQLGLSGGAYVEDVWPGSPASKLGLAAGDIIVSLDAQPVTSTGALTELVGERNPGASTTITYMHHRKPVQATVVLSSQPYGN